MIKKNNRISSKSIENSKKINSKKRQKLSLWVFFVLAFIISWMLWILSEIFDLSVLQVLGRFGPFISAVIVTWIYCGRSGINALFRTMLKWRVGVKWYVFAFLSTAVVAIIAILFNKLITNARPEYNDPSQWYLIFVVFIYVLFLSVFGEEIGWRGFVLPRLQKKYNALTSSVIIGVVWGIWHLPLFFIEGEFHQTIPFVLFLVQDIALSIIMTWLYNNTKGSLLIAHLFHTSSNVTIGMLPILPMDTNGDVTTLYITVGILVVITCLIVLISGPEHLSRKYKRCVYNIEVENE